MNWQQIRKSQRNQKFLCIILAAALVLGLVLPGRNLQPVRQTDPLDPEHIHQIETLLLGDSRENQKETLGAESVADPENTRQGDPDGTQETQPQETKPQQDQPQDPGTSEGTEGQEEGNTGDEGGQEAEPDLAVVLTWYKYGNYPKTVVCGPSEAVRRTINTAQLKNNELKYGFSVVGKDAEKLRITGVSVKAGDGLAQTVSQRGSISVDLADAHATRDYTFRVDTQYKAQNGHTEDVSFTFVLHCHYALDLEMELSWQRKDENSGSLTCAANQTAARTLHSSELAGNVFAYTPALAGALAENAQIVSAQYRTASGRSGAMEKDGGALAMQPAEGADRETYYLTFEVRVKDEEGQVVTIYFHYTILYIQTLDVKLQFIWLERGAIPRQLVCGPNDSAAETIKKNQLSAGALKYEMELTGKDRENARILSVSYTSETAGGGSLEASGAIPMELPEGVISNLYTLRVVALAGGQQLEYQLRLKHTMDVALQMQYQVMENELPAKRVVVCENASTETAEAIYDDQLPGGDLTYALSAVGDAKLTITSVSCYQSGSGSMVSLKEAGTVRLLLKDGKTGENTFTVSAKDESGTGYTFKINIPYKRRGENLVKISTNLTDGQVVINETETNLSVNAWTENAAGDIVDAIPANGTDTKLIVELDGKKLDYVSTSGTASEYVLIPENPQTGDTNTHILRIYAEDSYGNYGEQILNLRGQRNQAGQKKGSATIAVDLTVLGLGIVDSIPYEVLVDEPISYAVAKGVLGMDTGDPFGAADHSLGWSGRYSGTLDTGFYLQSLTPGRTANSLDGSRWNLYGSTEEEILQAIDRKFGRGTGLATLWRCIYRNGLNKSGGSKGAYGEFDYTSGSGWIFAVNGNYYPGQSMSSYYLEDGSTLTLRYTLAYGWDVGSGTAGYGNTVGYCVTAVNGSFTIRHKMQTREENGVTIHMCKCCGLRENCAHRNTVYQDLDDGTHRKYCNDCKTQIGDPQEHRWQEGENAHKCKDCGAKEDHIWKEVEGTNTATCTQPGTRSVRCVWCKMTRQEAVPAAGHKLDNRWNHTRKEHYQKCSVCEEIMEQSRGEHKYKYDNRDEDWYCEVCQAGHDWDYCGNDHLKVDSATCRKVVYRCEKCDIQLPIEGSFPEYHDYRDGQCIHCGGTDPAHRPPESTEPEPTEPKPTEPEPTEPEPAEPKPTEPEPAEPKPTEPEPAEPKPTEPKPTEPKPTEPPVTTPPAPKPEESSREEEEE